MRRTNTPHDFTVRQARGLMGCGQSIYGGQMRCGQEGEYCIRCLQLSACANEIERLRKWVADLPDDEDSFVWCSEVRRVFNGDRGVVSTGRLREPADE